MQKKKKKSLNDRLKEVIEAVNIINATFYLFFWINKIFCDVTLDFIHFVL